MKPDSDLSAGPPGGVPHPALPAKRRRRWPLYIFGGFFTIVLIIVASVAITIWWIQRPIKPVVLSAKEQAVVEDKLQDLGESATNRAAPSSRIVTQDSAREPTYVPGSKELVFTDREINGLLNANTDLGERVRLEFGRDAINAYVAVPIPQDFPVGGGRTFRARGRFRVAISQNETPYVVLEDITILGLSLPKAWLGGLKGENLIASALGENSESPVLRGIKSLRVVPGAIVLEVED